MRAFGGRQLAGGQEGRLCWCPTAVSGSLAEFSGVLHHCHILASEMVHFIHQMQYYITFEVRSNQPSILVEIILSQAVVLCFVEGAVPAWRQRLPQALVISRCLSALGMNFGTKCSRPRTWTTSSPRTRPSWTPSSPAVCWTPTPG